ncbi:hypothetical protein TrRE_jg1601 [Triparma retinervis]|uniref:Uncharacterized protein n=1 Tax=Triparma retinervis TaxID=2557542 RepID=A0A9W7A6K8_9STRA|nr:hypothetical protein TrRE_jg1601 [Triparma retinervis]
MTAYRSVSIFTRRACPSTTSTTSTAPSSSMPPASTLSQEDGSDVRVDKDVKLVREHFKLNHLDYKHMSPVIIPPGYTRDYIDGKVSRHDQLRSIHSAYNAQAEVSDMMLLEGTGHIGVGSCVNANNAQKITKKLRRSSAWVEG